MTVEAPSARVRLRITRGPRDFLRFPPSDDLLGGAVFDRLRQALDQGIPRPALLLFAPDLVEQVDLVPLLERGPDTAHRMVSALAVQAHVDAAALVGVLPLRLRARQGEPVRAAVTYVEWRDNRWWSSWQVLDSRTRRLAGPGPVVTRAREGAPKPGGLGGWFALGRRLGLRVRLEPSRTEEAPPMSAS